MALTKKQRKEVWNKSCGKCWYCGCELPAKGGHADHLDAVYRQVPGVWKPHNDVIEIIVPACAPCNLFKGVFCLEDFRREITAQIERARKFSVNFRTAERFGLLKVTSAPVVFWFEREGLSS